MNESAPLAYSEQLCYHLHEALGCARRYGGSPLACSAQEDAINGSQAAPFAAWCSSTNNGDDFHLERIYKLFSQGSGHGIKNHDQSIETACSSSPGRGPESLRSLLSEFGWLCSHPPVRGVPVGTWSSILRSSEAYPIQWDWERHEIRMKSLDIGLPPVV